MYRAAGRPAGAHVQQQQLQLLNETSPASDVNLYVPSDPTFICTVNATQQTIWCQAERCKAACCQVESLDVVSSGCGASRWRCCLCLIQPCRLAGKPPASFYCNE